MTFALRRAMTEILLEVTNEEITGIASDIIKSETGKKSKKSVRKSGLQGTYCLPILCRGKSLLELLGYHFSSRLTSTLNLCSIYLKLLVHVL